MKRLLDTLAGAASILGALAALCIAILGTADVLMTQLFNRPITGTVEFSSMLLVGVLFLGMAGAVRKDDNISVDLLVNALPPRGRFTLNVINRFMSLVYFGILTYLCWRLALDSMAKSDIMAGAIHFKVWPYKLLAALGALLATLTLAAKIIHEFLPRNADDKAR